MMLLYSNKCVPLHHPITIGMPRQVRKRSGTGKMIKEPSPMITMTITIGMPRQVRKRSGTGIYHVMLRGINRQDIFEDDEDYLQMMGLLHT